MGYLVRAFPARGTRSWHQRIFIRFLKKIIFLPKSIFISLNAISGRRTGITAQVTIEQGKEKRVIETTGNGRLDAVSNAIKMYFGISYELTVYEEHAISRGSSSKAAAYVGITCKGKEYWGVGIDEDIIKSSVAALVSAGNKLAENENLQGREERIVDIIKYINGIIRR